MTKQTIGELVNCLKDAGFDYETYGDIRFTPNIDIKSDLFFSYSLREPIEDIEGKLNFNDFRLIIDYIPEGMKMKEQYYKSAYIKPLNRGIIKELYKNERLLKVTDKILSSVNKNIREANIQLGLEKSSLNNVFFADLYPPVDKEIIIGSVDGINKAYSLFNDFISLFNEELGKEREKVLDRLIERL